MLLTSGWCVCLRMGLSICTWPRLSSKPSLLTCSTQLVSTTRAGRRRGIDDALARQMFGQGTPRRLAAREGAHFDLLARRCGRRHLRRRLGLGASSCMSASLSSSCSITAPELHLLDQQGSRPRFGLGVARLRLRLQACRMRGDHHRFQRRSVVGKRIRSGRHVPIAAQVADFAISNRMVHNVALSRLLVVATCAAALANRSPRADNRAAPACAVVP